MSVLRCAAALLRCCAAVLLCCYAAVLWSFTSYLYIITYLYGVDLCGWLYGLCIVSGCSPYSTYMHGLLAMVFSISTEYVHL